MKTVHTTNWKNEPVTYIQYNQKERELMNFNQVKRKLAEFGLDETDVLALYRAEKALHTWAEHECNGAIQRDEVTNKPFWYNTNTGKRICSTADRETGAIKRVLVIIAKCPMLRVEFQGDPRGGMIQIFNNDNRIYL
jgi:hypothetical protein